MTTKKILMPILMCCIFAASCNKFLDIKPVGRLIPTKVEELENLLNNPNTLDYHFKDNNRGSRYAYLGDNLTISQHQADFLYVGSSAIIDRYAAYTFYRPYQNPNLPDETWETGIYRAVGLFNNVIQGVEDLGERENELSKSVAAQAKAGRAWSYLVGTLGYGPMYDPAGPNDKKVLPFRTDGDPTAPNPPLSTTAELMDLIEKDLSAALDAPQQVGNPSRADLSAVFGLRALFYMYKRDWPAMLENANESWRIATTQKGGVDRLIYDYNTFYYKENPNASPTPGTDVEINLELQGPDLLLQQSYHRENLFYRIDPSGTDGYPSPEFLALFDQDRDRRYRLFALRSLGYSTRVGTETYDDGIVVRYYKSAKMKTNQGLTYPELLLMKAEAHARLNQLDNALNDLNTLRRFRYSGDDTNLTDGENRSQDELIQEILNERRRELPYDSFQRTFDLKRLALDVGKPWSSTRVTHRLGEQTHSAALDSEFYTLQISNNVLKFNLHWGIPINTTPYLPKN